IELGCVGRQEFQGDLAALLLNILAHEDGPVGLQSIPDDQHLPSDGGQQSFEELDDLRALDRSGEQAEVETPVTDSRYRGQLLPAKAVLQNGCFPSGSPGACATGALGQTRFVYEDDDSSLSRCDFFSSGHLLFFQVAIARSSRWRAWPVGRCT